MKYLAVFRARSQTMRLYEQLYRQGIPACVVNSPRETGYGCGISVAVDATYYPQAAYVLSQYNFSAFAGWWVQTDHGNTTTVAPL